MHSGVCPREVLDTKIGEVLDTKIGEVLDTKIGDGGNSCVDREADRWFLSSTKRN